MRRSNSKTKTLTNSKGATVKTKLRHMQTQSVPKLEKIGTQSMSTLMERKFTVPIHLADEPSVLEYPPVDLSYI